MKKILVVDDEPDIVHLIKNRLELKGFQVATAFDGAEALVKVKEQKPDLIVLDVMMPLLNGYEVCLKIKSHPSYKEIPVLLLTARDKEIDPRISLLMGISYLQKPYDNEKFMSIIEKVLN